jgi:ABC-type uncharacterized transport system substrate-binding protein
MAGKWLKLLKEVAPNIKRIAFIFDPKVAPGGGSYYTNLIKSAAPSFAVALTATPVHDAAEIESAIGKFAREPNGGLLVLPDTTTRTHGRLIVTLAAQYRVPAIYDFRDIVVEGGLISYGVDVADLVRRAGGYVDRILKGGSCRRNLNWSSTFRRQRPSALRYLHNSSSAPTKLSNERRMSAFGAPAALLALRLNVNSSTGVQP